MPPNRPTRPSGPGARPSGGRPSGPGARPTGGGRPSGGPPSRPSGGGAGARPSGPSRPSSGSPRGGMGAGRGDAPGRRDVTEKKEKPIYYSQLNFDETSNDYMMTKTTIGTFVFLVVLLLVAFLLKWSLNAFIGIAIGFLFWGAYFFGSLFKRSRMGTMSYKEKKSYWTYEMTGEYKERNVVLNDFKRLVATDLLRDDRTVLIDDVSVELVSFDPLIFDFSIRSKTKADDIKRTVPNWAGKFGCEVGTLTKTGINSWRVVYPREDKWDTLNGKNVSPDDVIGEKCEPSVAKNPIGIRTDNFQEVYLNNAELHTIVTGSTGTGKSNMFNMILVNQFPSDAIILFFDMKGGVAAAKGEERWWSVTSHEQAQAWIGPILDEMSEHSARKRALVAAHKDKFLPAAEADKDPDALPFSAEFPPIILAIDECASWTNINDNPMEGRAFKNFLAMVAQKGRSFGITLLVAAQSPKDSAIPADVRGNSSQFIVFQQPKEFVPAAFGGQQIDYKACDPSDIPTSKKKGQFAYAGADTDNTAIPVKGYFISTDTVSKEAHIYSSKKKMNHPIVQKAIQNYDEIYSKSPNKKNLINHL